MMNQRKTSFRRQLNRRHFLTASACGVTASCLPTVYGRRASGARLRREADFTITKIERRTVRLPYRPAPKRAMDRELPHWRYTEIFQVHLQSGHFGTGETLLYYTWGGTEDEDVQRAQGGNAVELMWDDSLGAGLQMALFDAVAKSADVPVHRLLGRQVNDTTPLSWWNIDMQVGDLVSECKTALAQGYLSFKTKGRPWFDLWKQVESVVAAVPPEFKLDMDYNDTLLNAEQAIPILVELEQYPQIDIYETPIPQGDIPGNRAICEATRVNLAMHYGNPKPVDVVRERVCDGFVMGGGASRLLQSAHLAAAVNLPFWLQLVGTGLTAAFSLHFGAVLSHARWPAVNCHQLYVHDLLKKTIAVKQGMAEIPTGPGLGYEVDWDVVDRYRVDKPATRPDPPRMLETIWPDGRKMYTANNGSVNFILRPSAKGKTPFFERGVDTRLWLNDGSERWKSLYDQSRREGPIVVRE